MVNESVNGRARSVIAWLELNAVTAMVTNTVESAVIVVNLILLSSEWREEPASEKNA